MSQIISKSFKAAFMSLALLIGCITGVSQVDAGDVIDVDVTEVLLAGLPPSTIDPPYTLDEIASLRTELAAASVAAEAIWDERIVGYSTELPNALRLQLTSLRITVSIGAADGENGVLAFAGPDSVLGIARTVGVNSAVQNNTLPLEASVVFDIDDLRQLSAAGLLTDVAAHEMAHAIGFGSFLLAENNLSGPVGGVGLNQYVGGVYALPTYRIESGQPLADFIPLQQTGAGSAGGHWDLNVPLFDMRAVNNSQDLMLAFIDVDNPPTTFIAETTYALFADLGYAVTGFNEQFAAPAGTGTGRWPKIIGPGVNPFSPNGVGFATAGLNFARVSGKNQEYKATESSSGGSKTEARSTSKLDPYNLRNLRWTQNK